MIGQAEGLLAARAANNIEGGGARGGCLGGTRDGTRLSRNLNRGRAHGVMVEKEEEEGGKGNWGIV